MNSLVSTFILFTLVHVLIWFGTNSQFTSIEALSKNALAINIILAIPISVLGLYATRTGYAYTESMWSVRFIAFGTSYLVFPVLTWFLLGESMFHSKTILCISTPQKKLKPKLLS